jgi:hypothetical protein
LEGIQRHKVIHGRAISVEVWETLCAVEQSDAIVFPGDDNLDALEDRDLSQYLESEHDRRPRRDVAKEVEEIENFHFDSFAYMDGPTDLFKRNNGSTGPILRQQYIVTAQRSEASCFFMYLPLAFWEMVLHATNVSAAKEKIEMYTLDELMKLLGILFYMTLVDKGEYKNYWGPQVEDTILGSEIPVTDLSNIMNLKRFIALRKHLSFRLPVSTEDLKKDAAAKIRPLINMLKKRCSQFIDVGRNVAVDEASVACRSKFARHLILYNPQKPTGQFPS